MKLIVHIEGDNAAFDSPEGCAEMQRILRKLADQLIHYEHGDETHNETKLYDVNGNCVGYALFSMV